jgi:hypothetical protein
MPKTISILLTFGRLWLFMFLSYLLVKLVFNLTLFGYVDLRRAAFLEIWWLPLGQAAAYWLLTRIPAGRQKKNEVSS